MFDSARSATILDGQFASIQAQTVHVTYGHTVSAEGSRTHERQTSRATGYSPHGERDILDFDSSQVDIRKDSQIYHDLLFVKGRGSPLWTPGPSLNLALEYRLTGARIGDVGIINSDGGFSFLFNILLSADHPINRSRVPSTFQPLAVDISGDVETSHIGDDYALSNAVSNSTTIADSGLIFDSYAREGAVLTTPGGTWLSELRHRTSFRQYIEKNLESWYEYANGPRGREARNGDIRLVYGVEKVSSWGMATFSSTQQEHTRLEFRKVYPSSPQMHSTSYTWQCSGAGAGRVGPSIVEYRDLMRNDTPSEPLVNQTAFLRTLNPMLSDSIWKEKFAHTMPAEDQFEAPLRNPRPEKSTSHKERKVQVHDAISHPSDALNRFMLSSTGADMVITEDDDLASLVEEFPPFRSPDSAVTVWNELRSVLGAYSSSGAFLSLREILLNLSEDPISESCVWGIEHDEYEQNEVQNATGLSGTIDTNPASAALVVNSASITEPPKSECRSMGESHRMVQRMDEKITIANITAPHRLLSVLTHLQTATMDQYDRSRHRELTFVKPENHRCVERFYLYPDQSKLEIDLRPGSSQKGSQSSHTFMISGITTLSDIESCMIMLDNVTPTTQHHSASSCLIFQADSSPTCLLNFGGAHSLRVEPESYLVQPPHLLDYQDTGVDVSFLPIPAIESLTFPPPPLLPIPGPTHPASNSLFYGALRVSNIVDDAERPIKVWNPSIGGEKLKIKVDTPLTSSSVVSDGGISSGLDSSQSERIESQSAAESPRPKRKTYSRFCIVRWRGPWMAVSDSSGFAQVEELVYPEHAETPDTNICQRCGRCRVFAHPSSSPDDGRRTSVEEKDRRDVMHSKNASNRRVKIRPVRERWIIEVPILGYPKSGPLKSLTGADIVKNLEERWDRMDAFDSSPYMRETKWDTKWELEDDESIGPDFMYGGFFGE